MSLARTRPSLATGVADFPLNDGVGAVAVDKVALKVVVDAVVGFSVAAAASSASQSASLPESLRGDLGDFGDLGDLNNDGACFPGSATTLAVGGVLRRPGCCSGGCCLLCWVSWSATRGRRASVWDCDWARLSGGGWYGGDDGWCGWERGRRGCGCMCGCVCGAPSGCVDCITCVCICDCPCVCCCCCC